MPSSKPYRVLSLDGGGVRGLLAAIWLARLEQKLGAPVREYFDLVAGTSTGGIIACAVSLGIPAERMVQMYRDEADEVFPAPSSRLWNRLSRTLSEGLSAPRYSDRGLETVLKRIFGDARFGQLQVKPTLLTSYDTLNRTAIVFKNTKQAHAELPVWEVCKSSASAPSYFPAHVMRLEGQDIPLVDGGVVANNPTACAIAEGIRINESLPMTERVGLDQFIVASFGTGQTNRPISAREAREWGALEWALPIVDVLFDGSADSVDYIARQLIAEGNYFRFQTPLDKAYDDLDRSDRANMSALNRIADDYLKLRGGEGLLDKLVKVLI
ncbi:MAG: patatin-like phospholipase family protein [Leptolyngbyaceae cyanobacterium bins.59]|nr:patatin-like phospholipase family protein [Leptolyngbyaceae cyanobacterium bins.59]